VTVYMTKTWGFGAPCGPLQFSLRGYQKSAREVLRPGDLVVIVGTLGENTDETERGMILGLMEPTTTVVNSLDYDLEPRPQDYTEDGQYRWPFGLELRAAWRFEEPRTALTAVSSRRFSMDSAAGIVPLQASEAEKILRLPRGPVELLRPFRTLARIEGLDAARRKAAPPPTTRRTGIMHMRRAPAFTYGMIVEGATSGPALKLGWAFDWKQRERHFNQMAMPIMGGLRYRTILYQLWQTALEAFSMEQSLLRRFDTLRHPQNREILSGIETQKMENAWYDYVHTAKQLGRGRG
jgi:hypothetical protein